MTDKEHPLISILNNGYGHKTSNEKFKSIDANGDPLPWYTYPAIEYIKQLDFSEKTVFEYGSGNSSFYWGSKAKSIISIENSIEWYKKISDKAESNMTVIYAESSPGYENQIEEYGLFDVIIIDGDYRYNCAKKSIKHIRDGGMLILDNSDWYANTAKYLRNNKLVQIDMTGFGPINNYTWTTSFFFFGNLDVEPIGGVQPKHGIGSLKTEADKEIK